jgi:hypothetical protein
MAACYRFEDSDNSSSDDASANDVSTNDLLPPLAATFSSSSHHSKNVKIFYQSGVSGHTSILSTEYLFCC